MFISKLKQAYLFAIAAVVVHTSFVGNAFAQANPSAPLTFQKDAQTAASNSQLNPADAKSGFENLGTTALYGFGAASILFCGYSLYKAYDAMNDESSRNKAGSAFIAAGIAGLIGIVAVVAAWFQTIALGGGA
jgi:hypothetical protein